MITIPLLHFSTLDPMVIVVPTTTTRMEIYPVVVESHPMDILENSNMFYFHHQVDLLFLFNIHHLLIHIVVIIVSILPTTGAPPLVEMLIKRIFPNLDPKKIPLLLHAIENFIKPLKKIDVRTCAVALRN